MAGSSSEGEQPTRDADERTITGTGLSKRFRSFSDNVQNLKHSNRSEEDVGQKTTTASAGTGRRA